MKKPGWWTGSWFVKAALIWFGGFLIWLPLSPRSPRLAASIFGLSMIPLVLVYGGSIVGDWLDLLARMYTAVLGRARQPKRKRNSSLP